MCGGTDNVRSTPGARGAINTRKIEGRSISSPRVPGEHHPRRTFGERHQRHPECRKESGTQRPTSAGSLGEKLNLATIP